MNSTYDPTSIADVSNPFQAFQDLMPFRVQDILLVTSLYDSFTLQEDGRLNELIAGEFLELSLPHMPGALSALWAPLRLRSLRHRSKGPRVLILGLIVWGMVAGWIASALLNLIHKGAGTSNWLVMLIAGLVGSFVGGLLFSLIAGDGLDLRPSGMIASILGALIVLAIVGWFQSRREPEAPPVTAGRTTPKKRS